MNSDGINFSNPQTISKDDLNDVLNVGLSFDLSTPEVETETETAPEVTDTTKTSTSTTTESTDDDSETSLGISLPGEEPEEEMPVFNNIINKLADLGTIKQAYEGFDPEADADEDVLVKLIDHNTNLKVEEEFDGFFNRLSPVTQRILDFELNSTDPEKSDLTVYLKTLIEENNIKSLSIENEFDQEKILREWYRSEEKYTQSEVDDKINELKEVNLMEKEARRIKPKLDTRAEEIARNKEEEQRSLKDAEQRLFQDYSNKVLEKLKAGNINGVAIDKEDASKLFTILTSDRMEVPVHGGKKVMMTPLDYLVFYNKYDQRGNLDNLMLATLLLTNPAKFEETYAKRVETKNTNEFVRQHKYNSKLKGGQVADPTNAPKSKNENAAKWRMKIN